MAAELTALLGPCQTQGQVGALLQQQQQQPSRGHALWVLTLKLLLGQLLMLHVPLLLQEQLQSRARAAQHQKHMLLLRVVVLLVVLPSSQQPTRVCWMPCRNASSSNSKRRCKLVVVVVARQLMQAMKAAHCHAPHQQATLHGSVLCCDQDSSHQHAALQHPPRLPCRDRTRRQGGKQGWLRGLVVLVLVVLVGVGPQQSSQRVVLVVNSLQLLRNQPKLSWRLH